MDLAVALAARMPDRLRTFSLTTFEQLKPEGQAEERPGRGADSRCHRAGEPVFYGCTADLGTCDAAMSRRKALWRSR